MDEREERLKALEGDKERMIREYLSLQDQADDLNGRIYRVCCGVETLNAQILALREEIRRAALQAAPRNGTVGAPPANGRA